MGTGRWGTHWEHCVTVFLELEQQAGFTLKLYQLPKSPQRPAALAQWVHSKRVTSGPIWDALNIGDASQFTVVWWDWWASIQPAGRATGNSISLNKADGLDWTRICKPGPNGLLNVLVALVWWRNMTHSGVATQKWGKAVVDVAWAMVQMKESMGLPGKKAGKHK
ncbi:hypothetical protein FIBSPDRAFT_751613 [Athelia psychrophila]|uniref:Uncharacterized protein n=1 Tax=Athelia psychrophila TaxID=1759441 RepID=A0A166DE45_9AGAM|nr:hypothetical protein FIBSPDRAFT_751613 [Fibularhizoctonia sp. CBS 109695]